MLLSMHDQLLYDACEIVEATQFNSTQQKIALLFIYMHQQFFNCGLV